MIGRERDAKGNFDAHNPAGHIRGHLFIHADRCAFERDPVTVSGDGNLLGLKPLALPPLDGMTAEMLTKRDDAGVTRAVFLPLLDLLNHGDADVNNCDVAREGAAFVARATRAPPSSRPLASFNVRICAAMYTTAKEWRPRLFASVTL